MSKVSSRQARHLIAAWKRNGGGIRRLRVMLTAELERAWEEGKRDEEELNWVFEKRHWLRNEKL